jgi:uncharacterized protein YdaU (DUF1376 family)
MTAWRSPDCKLPNDDLYLARISGMDKRTWQKNRGAIMAFWKQDEKQKFYQGRLLDERKYVEQLRNKNSAAGKASALKRHNRGSTSVQPNFNETSTPTPTPTPPKNNKIVLKPDSVSDYVWSDYLLLRRQKKAPVTQTVIDGIEKEAVRAGIPLEAALRECCVRGWQSFKADWYKNQGQQSKPAKPTEKREGVIVC